MSGLFSAMDVSASALAAQRQRLEMLVSNIANSQTTRTASGEAYRRRDTVFQAEPVQSFEEALIEAETFLEGVRVTDVFVDDSDPILRFEPNHPHANAEGYVAYPNINPLEEMAKFMNSTRSYEANIKAFQAIKELVQASLEMGR